MLGRGKNADSRKKQQNVGASTITIKGIAWSLGAEDQPYFRNRVTFPLPTRPGKSSGSPLVEWEADACTWHQMSSLTSNI